MGTQSSVTSPALNGTLLSRPPISPSDFGSLRGAPFGVPVVPLVRIVIFGPSPARGGAPLSPRGDQRVQRVVGVLVVVDPGPVAAVRRVVDALEHLAVLVVVDEQVGALAFGHLTDLRARRRRC